MHWEVEAGGRRACSLARMTATNITPKAQPTSDPRGAGKKPPFDESPQDSPGNETKMRTKPDHGEASYKGHGRLEGRVALVTGGDSGIGRAVALAFAREGADVAIAYLDEHEDANESRRAVESAGRKSTIIAGDFADVDACTRAVEHTVRELGKIDILVNNAVGRRRVDHTSGGGEDRRRGSSLLTLPCGSRHRAHGLPSCDAARPLFSQPASTTCSFHAPRTALTSRPARRARPSVVVNSVAVAVARDLMNAGDGRLVGEGLLHRRERRARSKK